MYVLCFNFLQEMDDVRMCVFFYIVFCFFGFVLFVCFCFVVVVLFLFFVVVVVVLGGGGEKGVGGEVFSSS